MSWCNAYLWMIPAKVEGTWKFPQGELKFSQEFQMVSGKITTSNDTANISNGRLWGEELTFNVNDAKYTGHVKGNTMEGSVLKGGINSRWTAIRTKM